MEDPDEAAEQSDEASDTKPFMGWDPTEAAEQFAETDTKPIIKEEDPTDGAGQPLEDGDDKEAGGKWTRSQRRAAASVRCYTEGARLLIAASLAARTSTSSVERGGGASQNQKPAMRAHEKRFECNICKKCFFSKATLVEHNSTQPCTKPLRCEICKQSFSLKQSLLKHIKTHIV
ncbi:zinc finger and SCAN domain-containing protein 5C-like [Frankliniella occidentalis]|uniref:Zinc finger and SCAN domain-containing protein 5C-like n=1 Tax=Frankliniella occidentalis TaxID=133901 RepID=A0A6J1RT04_FRAOC|nr:zinc finger and SCAN domain-containing protein 5C-like [Frankliniella occidentalis]